MKWNCLIIINLNIQYLQCECEDWRAGELSLVFFNDFTKRTQLDNTFNVLSWLGNRIFSLLIIIILILFVFSSISFVKLLICWIFNREFLGKEKKHKIPNRLSWIECAVLCDLRETKPVDQQKTWHLSKWSTWTFTLNVEYNDSSQIIALERFTCKLFDIWLNNKSSHNIGFWETLFNR